MKYFLATLLFACYISDAKTATGYYTITGKVSKAINGKAYLHPGSFSKKYYLNDRYLDSAEIRNGVFRMQRARHDHIPRAYRLTIHSDGLNGETGLIFIEPNNQTILIDSIGVYISPVIASCAIQHEMKFEYEALFKPVIKSANDLDRYSDALYEKYGGKIPEDQLLKFASMSKAIVATSDSLFLHYAKTHPDSYVTLWKLIERFNTMGYKNQQWEIYQLLSRRIKESDVAKIFFTDLKSARLLALNKPFPILELKDTMGRKVKLDAGQYKAKYTLIDFWFSTCGPCLVQFPKYKQLYDRYTRADLEIITVSVDARADMDKWKSVILDKGLNWVQFLDEGGNQSGKLSIVTFPTNFLLNEKGEIIHRNITPEELKEFLSAKL